MTEAHVKFFMQDKQIVYYKLIYHNGETQLCNNLSTLSRIKQVYYNTPKVWKLQVFVAYDYRPYARLALTYYRKRQIVEELQQVA